MEEQSLSTSLRSISLIMFRWSWLIILCAIIAGGAAYFVSQQVTPIYRASTLILIDQAPDSRSNEYSALLASERLTRTYSQMFIAESVLSEVIDSLGLKLTLEDFLESVSIEPVRDTQLIRLQVENPSPQLAAEIANTIFIVFSEFNQELQQTRHAASKQSLQDQMDKLEGQIQFAESSIEDIENSPENQAEIEKFQTSLSQYNQTHANLIQSYEEIRALEAQSTSEIVQVDEATPPLEPVSPRVLMNIGIAVIIGGLLAVSAVYLIEVLDDTIKDPKEITDRYGLPVLGVITRHNTKDTLPISIEQPRSPVSEAFRSLRTNIQFASIDHVNRSILVTSASPEEGKTTISSNIAAVLAQGEKNVVIVDADFRRPRIHSTFHVNNRSGLSDLIVDPDLDPSIVVHNDPKYGLSIITSGPLPPNPSELLGSDRMSTTISKLLDRMDFLVIDTAPVIAVTDATALSRKVDGVILVAKYGATKRASFSRAVEQLQHVGANIIGVVLNDVRLRRAGAYYQERYYSPKYGYLAKDAKPRKSASQ